jgi:RNA polymerase subunit RPABC4/transcription elongation factor Spt4
LDLTAGLKLLGTLLSLYAGALWVASVLWAYRDVRARTEDSTTQAIGVGLVALIPLFGIAIYLIVRPRETILDAYERELEREALRSELHTISPCPNCRRPVEPDFIVCAYCRTQVREACGHCGRLLTMEWQHCPYCGTSRPARREVAPPPSRPAPQAQRGEDTEEAEVPGAVRRRPAARRAAPDDLEP